MGHYVMAGDIKDATAEDSNVLSGKAYYNNNGKREGTMPNRGGMSAELAAGGSVSILEGYHNGEGVVRAQDLASQTAGDAGAGNIDSGKTAWVNGAQVTGTSTKVDTSGATATAADIASGKTAWVNGAMLTGSLKKGMKVKTGTISSSISGFTVSNLPFTPKGIMACVNDNYPYDIEYRIMFVFGISGSNIQGYYPNSSYRLTNINLSISFGTNRVSVGSTANFASSVDWAYVVWGE